MNDVQPPSPDADREAVAVTIDEESRAIIKDFDPFNYQNMVAARKIADAVLRVLSERGRLREADGEFEKLRQAWIAAKAEDRFLRSNIATLTRERDEAYRMRDQAIENEAEASAAYFTERARADGVKTPEQIVRLSAMLDKAEAQAARLRRVLSDIEAENQNYQHRGDAGDHATFMRCIDMATAALAPAAADAPKTEGAT